MAPIFANIPTGDDRLEPFEWLESFKQSFGKFAQPANSREVSDNGKKAKLKYLKEKKKKGKRKRRHGRSEYDLENDVFEVERVLDYRKVDGRDQYFLKWKNYAASESTWEWKENLNCPDLVKMFWDNLPPVKGSDLESKMITNYQCSAKYPCVKIFEENVRMSPTDGDDIDHKKVKNMKIKGKSSIFGDMSSSVNDYEDTPYIRSSCVSDREDDTSQENAASASPTSTILKSSCYDDISDASSIKSGVMSLSPFVIDKENNSQKRIDIMSTSFNEKESSSKGDKRSISSPNSFSLQRSILHNDLNTLSSSDKNSLNDDEVLTPSPDLFSAPF